MSATLKVNTSGEDAKSGVSPDDCIALARIGLIAQRTEVFFVILTNSLLTCSFVLQYVSYRI